MGFAQSIGSQLSSRLTMTENENPLGVTREGDSVKNTLGANTRQPSDRQQSNGLA